MGSRDLNWRKDDDDGIGMQVSSGNVTTEKMQRMEQMNEPRAKRPVQKQMSISTELLKRAQEKDLFPIQLHFENLSFSVPVVSGGPGHRIKNIRNKIRGGSSNSSEWRTLIREVTGTFEPGTITAIMGSSGAGKTTLLNVLAGRAVGRIEGKILYNGHPREEAGIILKHQAYVMQDDIMLASQTPREVLSFSALLRIPDETLPDVLKLKRVDQIINELNIGNCQNTQVGAPGVKRGISGGERKRVAIGVELVTNPSLLFLDEPTSGLDSFTSEHVIENLSELAHCGRTIVCTIHQPNSQIFQRLDKLLLLAKGRLVFNGPAAGAVTYFKSIGYETPPYTNPTDYFIKLIHIEQSITGNSAESVERVSNLITSYDNSPLAKQNREVIINHMDIESKPGERSEKQYAQGNWRQIVLIGKRNISDIVRTPLRIRAGIGQNIFLSLLIGLVYLQLNTDSSGSIQDREGALFFILSNQMMSSTVSIVNVFPEERGVFLREHTNNMYRTSSYYVSKVLSDLPFQILYPTLFLTISYWMIGFQPYFVQFITFWITGVIIANVGASLGLFLGIVAKDANTAVSLMPITIIPFMLFSGFLVNTNDVPDYFIWLPPISPLKYGFAALCVNEFTGLTFTYCPPTAPNCEPTTGTSVIDGLDVQSPSISIDLLVLFVMYLFIRLVSFLALLWRARAASNA